MKRSGIARLITLAMKGPWPGPARPNEDREADQIRAFKDASAHPTDASGASLLDGLAREAREVMDETPDRGDGGREWRAAPRYDLDGDTRPLPAPRPGADPAGATGSRPPRAARIRRWSAGALAILTACAGIAAMILPR